MSTLVLLILILNILRVISVTLYLSVPSYPRTESYKQWQDVLSLIVGMLMILWTTILYRSLP
jgi:hypothetical protein